MKVCLRLFVEFGDLTLTIAIQLVCVVVSVGTCAVEIAEVSSPTMVAEPAVPKVQPHHNRTWTIASLYSAVTPRLILGSAVETAGPPDMRLMSLLPSGCVTLPLRQLLPSNHTQLQPKSTLLSSPTGLMMRCGFLGCLLTLAPRVGTRASVSA